MIRRPALMTQILQQGGPFLGDNKAQTRITVQPDWYLNVTTGPVGNYRRDKLPIRWWQDAANNQTEIEIPGIKAVTIDRQLSQQAATIEVDFYNTNTPANGQGGDMPNAFGQPGYMAPFYGDTPLAERTWNQRPNQWHNVLRENALLRVYQGYGGADLSIPDAVHAGNLVMTGVFLVDTVAIEAQSGLGKLSGRDMAKLLIDQYMWPPLCQPEGTMVTVVRVAVDDHGTPSRYASGCRCAPCKSSQSERNRLYYDGGVVEPGERFAQEVVPIESLRVGDRVLSCDVEAKGRPLHRRGSRVKEVVRRPFDGDLVVVRTEAGHVTRYTPDHHCIAVLGNALAGKHVVYLMRRGAQFRVGLTIGRRSTGDSGLAKRCHEEGADEMWVLSTHDDRGAAMSAEHLAAWRFNLPEWEFTDPLRQEALDALWDAVGDNAAAARQCLEAHGRDVRFPFWTTRTGRWSSHPMVFAACNLIDGMSVLVADRATPVKKTVKNPQPCLNANSAVPISVSREAYRGDVISLEVEGDHTYVADGVFTHNCPQSFYTSVGISYWHDLDISEAALLNNYGANGGGWLTQGIPAPLEGRKFVKSIIDMAPTVDNEGYWLCGTDGGVFTYGTANFYGSMGDQHMNAQTVGFDTTPLGDGYWLCDMDGGVFTFGTAQFFGSLPGENITPTDGIVAMRATSTGRGYWMAAGDGNVYCFGDATDYGNGRGKVDGLVVGFTPRPQNDGYWMITVYGTVYAFGAAQHMGDVVVPSGQNASCIDATSTGNGYRAATDAGSVFEFGDAPQLTASPDHPPHIPLNAPVGVIRRTPDDAGFWMGAQDGGVFTYGDAPFAGSMPAPFTYVAPGTYSDFVDIVIDFCLWAGFFLYQEVGPHDRPPVYGTLESTGAYDAVGPIDPSTFDKVQVSDCIQAISQAVGFLFRVREDGSVFFASPNWWTPGNTYADTNERTAYIPVISDNLLMTDYIQTTSDQSLRSEIIVSPVDPYLFGGHPNLVTVTRIVPPNIQTLHGIVKPAMFGIPLNVPISTEDQNLIAELQALQCWLASRTGQVTCAYDPAITPDTQIKIMERSTGETNIHYVTGVHVEHDLDQGTCLATYTTQWMGEADNWAITSSLSSFYGIEGDGSDGYLEDQTFDANGNLIYSKTFPISDALVSRLAQSSSQSTQAFRVATVNNEAVVA